MTHSAINGLNHLTLAVTDLDRSVAFYRDVLGLQLRAIWSDGAYFEAGSLWFCLSVDEAAASIARSDYTHYAFDVSAEDFDDLAERVLSHSVIWKDNSSEGSSVYFLDPDGHRMELHNGSLATRLEHYRVNRSKAVTVL